VNAIDREAAEVAEFVRRDNLVVEDLVRAMLVSFEHRGERRVGKVKSFGKRGAKVITRSGSEYLVTFAGLKSAAWAGAIVTARCGDYEYILRVTSVTGANIVGIILAGDFGLGEEALVYAREVVAVRDDGGRAT
jgi:hypothetical protein